MLGLPTERNAETMHGMSTVALLHRRWPETLSLNVL